MGSVRASSPVRLMALAAVLHLPFTTSGCSVLVNRPPPFRPLASPDECTVSQFSQLATVADGTVSGVATSIGALYLLVAGGIYLGRSNVHVPSWDQHKEDRNLMSVLLPGLLLAGGGGLMAASAIYGDRNERACLAARQEYFARQPWPPLPVPAPTAPLPR
jgi:hypothetical protein